MTRTAAPPPSRGAMIDSCISKFHELGINVVAVDFDQTILDVHTGGRWTGSVHELAEHVRSEFRLLLQACCEHDIQVAIVTFSGQTKIVQGVIETIVGLEYMTTHVAIRARDRSWTYRGSGSLERKQPYIASAVEELEHKKQARLGDMADRPGFAITKRTTVLIDDDADNIQCALDDGTRAVWVNQSKPHHVLRDLARLV